MAKEFRELRERLLRGGVAPRHVRRYVTELREHWTDLVAEEERAGHTRAEAEAAALQRLGREEDLARTMMERQELHSWTARAAWAVLGAGPLLALVCSWGLALLILWSGWTWFLQGSPTPFVPLHGFAIVYFGVGRMLYYAAPLLAGWGMVWLAGRQRLQARWPVAVGAVLVALPGATGAVDVRPPAVPGASGDVGIRFFPPPAQMGEAAVHALVLLAMMALPYLVWRRVTAQDRFEQG